MDAGTGNTDIGNLHTLLRALSVVDGDGRCGCNALKDGTNHVSSATNTGAVNRAVALKL